MSDILTFSIIFKQVHGSKHDYGSNHLNVKLLQHRQFITLMLNSLKTQSNQVNVKISTTQIIQHFLYLWGKKNRDKKMYEGGELKKNIRTLL